jgi:hypothetical protein
MAVDRIGDMSKQELMAMVESAIDQRLRLRTRPYKQQSTRPLEEIIDSMRHNLIESKPGDPSVVEMLHEDRDR